MILLLQYFDEELFLRSGPLFDKILQRIEFEIWFLTFGWCKNSEAKAIVGRGRPWDTLQKTLCTNPVWKIPF